MRRLAITSLAAFGIVSACFGRHDESAFFGVLASSLLATPPDVSEPPPAPADWPAVQEAVQALAVGWEILDQREVRYVMARLEDWDNDLALLRRRYADLKDAPEMAE